MSTPAQRAAAARKRALMTPQRATIDPGVFGGKGKDKTAAPGASGVQIPAEGRTHFFVQGRGPTIDFGPILRPRSTGTSPIEGDAYTPTTGVGGFFRRLLGDNSNELNAAWANQRLMRQMGQEDTAAAQAFEMQKMAAQQANAMQLAEAQRQGQMGVERYRAQNDLDRQGTADTQALIRQAAELQARGQMSGAENVSRENIARINAEGDLTRSLLGGGSGADKRYLNLGDGSFLDIETGMAFQPNRMSEKGGYSTFNLRGAGSAPAATSVGITDAQRQSALQAAQATKEENTRVQAAEGTPLGAWDTVNSVYNAIAPDPTTFGGIYANPLSALQFHLGAAYSPADAPESGPGLLQLMRENKGLETYNEQQQRKLNRKRNIQ